MFKYLTSLKSITVNDYCKRIAKKNTSLIALDKSLNKNMNYWIFLSLIYFLPFIQGRSKITFRLPT